MIRTQSLTKEFSRPRPALAWFVLALLVVATLLVSTQAHSSVRPPSNAVVDTTPKTPPGENIGVPNPATDLWNQVRGRETGTVRTQVKGPGSDVLITTSGEEFRFFRKQTFIGTAGWFIVAVLMAIAAFYIVKGKIRVEGGMSGQRVRRFSDFERSVHWFTAILFIFLAISGLVLIFGRYVLIPLFGPEVFGFIASLLKDGHNLFGPLFLVSMVLFLYLFARRNLPAKQDVGWVLKGGGIIGKAHCRADFFNAGEKIWFWVVISVGSVVTVSGFILNFPIFDLSRETMQLTLIIHGISAVVLIAGSFGHIYIGTAGTEGSLDSMTTGYVDANWAKAHHDMWYEKLEAEGALDQSAEVESRSSDRGGTMPEPDSA